MNATDAPTRCAGQRLFDALLLDFGSVITISAFERQREIETLLGLPGGSLDWCGPVDPSTDPLWQTMMQGKISERDYWALRAAEVGRMLGHEDWTPLDYFKAIRGSDPNHAVRDAARRTVAAARAAGLRVGIVSNELELFWGRPFMDRLDLLREVDVLVDATHSGVLKPDPRAYRAALDALGVRAERALFVDDQQRNVDGARAVGMAAMFFDVADPDGSFARVRETLGIGGVVPGRSV
ncbi:MAG TPA: HAD-IA family hydrolase [Zeimonas sp.]|nr:HAD-IA family hydrolase [Zeimonas sp.]